MSDELIAEARWRAAELAVKPNTGYGWATEDELMSMLANDLETAEARVKELEAQRDAALARIAEAWALHEPFTWSFGFGPVQSCKWCAENGVPQEIASWPCATIRALEERGVGDGVHEI